MGMLTGQGTSGSYGSSANMKGMPSSSTGASSMKGGQQLGNQNAPGASQQGYYQSGQPYSAGITNMYTQQPQGLYTGGPPQAQGYNGMGQGYQGQTGTQSPNSSQQNPMGSVPSPTGGAGNRGLQPIARMPNGGNYLFSGGGNNIFPASPI